MNTSTFAKKTPFLANKWIKISFAIFIGLYLIIWAVSSPVSKHIIEPILLEQGLSLSDDTSISYNPFISQLTVSDLILYKDTKGKKDKVLSINTLEIRLTLFHLLSDQIVVSKFELTDAFIKVQKASTQLIIAGIDLTEATTETKEVETKTVGSKPFTYQIILPELALNQVNIAIDNDKKLHDIRIVELLINDLSADQDLQKATLTLESTIDNTTVELSADADFTKGIGVINSQLSISDYPINKLQPYVEQLSALSGSVSFNSKQQVSISPQQFKLHVTQAQLSNKDLKVNYQQQLFQLEKFESTFDELTLGFSEGEITELSGTSQLTLTKADLFQEQLSQTLGHFELLALKDISFHFIEEPHVEITSLIIDDIYASKNDEVALPPLATLKQLKITDILVSAKQLAINKIILDSLQSDVIINKDQALANLVTLPASQIVEDDASQSTHETTQQPDKKANFTISLNEFSLTNDNQLSFVDNSLEPVKKHQVFIDTLFLGAVSNSEEQKEKQTPFELKGRSDKYAHFDFKGYIQPFSQKPTHHLEGFFKELSLPAVSRYMKRAMQMELKSGQLNTNINVTLSGDQLDGNVILLLQGIETAIADSDEAGALIDQGALPFNMALGMLKDSSGDVELDVPLSGSTSDPSFGLSSVVTLITQKAIWMATQDYLMTTFVPYANIVSVAMTVGEFALKLRFDDLIYQAKQIEPNEEQKAYLQAFIALMQAKEKTRVNICAISTPADINLIAGSRVSDKQDVHKLKEIGDQREEAFKEYIIKHGNIASSRLLLCAPKIDSSKDAKSRIELSV